MKAILKRSLVALAVIVVAMQFWHSAKNIDPAITQQDITKMYAVPDDVNRILQKACYDCHSNNTRYPWYSKLQPVSWWMNDHIRDGKRHLNFSDFGAYSVERKVKKMKEIAGTVTDGEMPLGSYTWIHKDAILTDAEKRTIVDWANSLSQTIERTGK